jgi:hypothetical protein
VTRAHRAWAIERPSEYLLLYGHAGLRVTPGGNRGIHQAMSMVLAELFTMMRDALAAGEIDTEKSKQRRQHPFASSSPTGAKPPRRWPAFPITP